MLVSILYCNFGSAAMEDKLSVGVFFINPENHNDVKFRCSELKINLLKSILENRENTFDLFNSSVQAYQKASDIGKIRKADVDHLVVTQNALIDITKPAPIAIGDNQMDEFFKKIIENPYLK